MPYFEHSVIINKEGLYLNQARLAKLYAMAEYIICRKTNALMLLDTLISSGRRISEIVGQPIKNPYQGAKYIYEGGLRPKDVNYMDKIIQWHILKKRDPVTKWKPASEEYLKRLKTYIDSRGIRPDERVFPIRRQTAWAIIRKICTLAQDERLGGHYIHPHTFRHTFAMHNKDNPLLINNVLDHSSFAVTMAYFRTTVDDLRPVYDKIESLLHDKS